MKLPLLPALVFSLAAPLLPAQSPPPAPPAKAAAKAAVTHLDAAAAARALDAAAKNPSPAQAITVLDVRTPEEFAQGHIKGALNLDSAAPTFQKSLQALDPSKNYLVHCAAGGRSTRALSSLQRLGFSSVIHLDGGLNDWKKAGLPLTQPEAPPAPSK